MSEWGLERNSAALEAANVDSNGTVSRTAGGRLRGFRGTGCYTINNTSNLNDQQMLSVKFEKLVFCD